MFLLLQKVEISTAKTDMISSLIKKREKTTTTNTHLQSKKEHYIHITYVTSICNIYTTITNIKNYEQTCSIAKKQEKIS